LKGKIISVKCLRIEDILSANGVEIPVTVAKDTQRRHVQKRALMVNFDVVFTKIG
jgi:hypothetical protein